MKFQVTGKLELNLFNVNANIQTISDLVLKNRIPAIVTDPSYLPMLLVNRAAMGGKYKLIASIDFLKGKAFAIDKLKRAGDFSGADGCEILLSPDRSEIELRNELKSIHEFLKLQNKLFEIRWCLGCYNRPFQNTLDILGGMKSYPPSYVRLDQHLELPNLDKDKHLAMIESVREHVPFNIKVSGNVNLELIKALSDVKGVARFDVNPKQLQEILIQLKSENSAEAEESEDKEIKLPSRLSGVRKAHAKNLISQNKLKPQRRKFRNA